MFRYTLQSEVTHPHHHARVSSFVLKAKMQGISLNWSLAKNCRESFQNHSFQIMFIGCICLNASLKYDLHGNHGNGRQPTGQSISDNLV